MINNYKPQKDIDPLYIVEIIIPANKLAKTVSKLSYSLFGDLHAMQRVRGSSPLVSISISFLSISLNELNRNKPYVFFYCINLPSLLPSEIPFTKSNFLANDMKLT